MVQPKLSDFKEKLTASLIKKYEVKGSFYTDYPPLGLLNEKFTHQDFETALADLIAKGEDNPLLFYLHFPYCAQLCYYCQCSFVVTHNYSNLTSILDYTYREIDMLKSFFDKHHFNPNIVEIHLGGGSPSYLKEKEFDSLIEKLNSTLTPIKNLKELTIEVDPRNIDVEMLKHYSQKGCTRLSFGIQEFNADVQKAINRIQPFELINSLLTPEVRSGYKSINFDLIYGMPLQTRETFKDTIDKTIQLAPDRIALCVLGYRPDIYKHHKVLNPSDLPSPYERTIIGQEAMQQLMDNGYARIGYDHFAKKTDQLAKDMSQKKMHRSALGYQPGRYTDMIGVGPSTMMRITDTYYFQNYFGVSEYKAALDKSIFPIFRGYKMSVDDRMRRDIMHSVMNYYRIEFNYFKEKYGIEFKDYFSEDLHLLQEVVKDGLATLEDAAIQVTPIGSCFLRHVCVPFDKLKREGIDYKHSREFEIERRKTA